MHVAPYADSAAGAGWWQVLAWPLQYRTPQMQLPPGSHGELELRGANVLCPETPGGP